MDTGIYTATYSGVPVYEAMIQGVPVMRRIHDSFMNATQILKVAGVPKPKRTKILEREVSLGDCEKVQGGYGKYQGTWITLEAAIRLAESYGVTDILDPLITFDPSKDTLVPKPEHVVSKQSASSDPPGTPKLTRLRAYRSTGMDLPSPQLADGELEDADLAMESLAAQDTFVTPKGKSSPYSSSRRKYGKKVKENEMDIILEGVPSTPMFGEILSSMVITTPPRFTSSEFSKSKVNSLPIEVRQKEIIKMIYIYGNTKIQTILELLTNTNGIEIDLELDEEENTPLHWASAMGQMNLVAALVEKGANIFKTNVHGETAAMRSLDFSSVYRLQCGPELFLLLRGSVYCVDAEEQSILHHLAQGSFTNDHWKLTRYYSHCIFAFLRRESMTGIDIQEFLDAQDVLKNTALHYAVRQKYYKFVEILIKLGIDIRISNLSGQTAADLAEKDFRMSKIFKNTAKEKYGLLGTDLVDFSLLDDDMPTPTLSEYSDEEDIVIAAESLLQAKSNVEIIAITDSKEESHRAKKQKNAAESPLKIKFTDITSAAQLPIVSSKLEDTPEIIKQEDVINKSQPIFAAKPVIPDASPIQIQKIKRLLENVSDDMEDIVLKKARLSKIYEEAKQLESKSMIIDEESYKSSSQVNPPPATTSDAAPLDEALVELMQEHITDLEDKVKHILKNRKIMFAGIESVEADRASKDAHFHESFAAALGTPLEQLTPLLNDRLQETPDEGKSNQKHFDE